MMKMNNFRGELTDISAEKEALVCSTGSMMLPMITNVCLALF